MGNVMWWSIVLIGLLLGAFIAVSQVKKRITRSDDFSGPGFTLGDLRALHRAGKMTDEEFEKAKQVTLGTLQKAQANASQPTSTDQTQRRAE